MPSKNFLLIQIREDPFVRIEEVNSFAKYLEINKNKITVLNVFDTPTFTAEMVLKFDAVLVGGASEASVLEDDKYCFLHYTKKLLKFCVVHSIPVFASCFGFQLAVLAFGGTIIRNTDQFEMGTLEISKTNAALNDPIFKYTSRQFYAVAVHQESAYDLPSSCDLLAYTDFCCHAFKVSGKPFWAFQFHPELDKETLTKRLDVYKKKYTQDQDHFQTIIESLVETPESNLLLNNFSKFVASYNRIDRKIEV